MKYFYYTFCQGYLNYPPAAYVVTFDMCDIYHKSDTHDMCHTVTLQHKKLKNAKRAKICQWGNEIYVTHLDTMLHFDMSVSLKCSNSLDILMTGEGTVGAPTCCNMINHGPLTRGRITSCFLSEGGMETFLTQIFFYYPERSKDEALNQNLSSVGQLREKLRDLKVYDIHCSKICKLRPTLGQPFFLNLSLLDK
jgi:hypothetical protein